VQGEGDLPPLERSDSGSGKGGAKRRAAQAKRGSLGKLLAGARGGAPLPCLLSMVRRRGVSPCVRRGLCSSRIPMDWGTEQQFSDSRSNFHTRVGYRTNVCRRRLASDLARASEGTPAQGALEDHHDLPPGSPPDKVEGLSSCRHLSPHLMTDSPDEARQLSRDRGDDDGWLLASGDHGSVAGA